MLTDKIIVEDKDMRFLPLFFKIIYHNTLINPQYEAKLMLTNSVTKQQEMRSVYPTRAWGKMFDIEKFKNASDDEKN